MRIGIPVAVLSLLVVLSTSRPTLAAIDNVRPDEKTIAILELKAAGAQPKEQCFLYAELVHQMIEYSSDQYAAGEIDKAADTLKHVNVFAQKIHMMVSTDEKKLKDAQILLRHTAFRLSELLHSSALEDRPLMQETLAQVNQIQTETMLQVFRK